MAERTAVLVIRVWTEAASPAVRARLLDATGANASHPVSMVTVAGVDEICAAMREWLEHVAAGDGAVTAG